MRFASSSEGAPEGRPENWTRGAIRMGFLVCSSAHWPSAVGTRVMV